MPLIAAEQPEQFDAWALRWLGRWISETAPATIEQAAEMAGLLAHLQGEPAVIGALQGAISIRAPR